MTSKEFKAICEKMGFGIAHARTNNRTGQIVAYVAVRNKKFPTCDELRFDPYHPTRALMYQHVSERISDKFIGSIAIAD